VLDHLALHDQATTPLAVAAAPRVVVDRDGRGAVRMSIGASATPFYVVLGRGFDERWTATVDGVSLGSPIVVDGYSVGWRLDAGPARVVSARYGPQRWMDVGIAVTAVVLVGCLIGVLWPRRRRSRARAPAAYAEPPRLSTQSRPLGRTVLPRLGLVLAAWLLAGPLATSVVLVGCLLDVVRPVRGSWLIAAGSALLVLTPVAYLVGNISRFRGGVTPELVLGNRWPHWLGLAAVFALTAGVLRDVDGGRAR
jgi:arabinofuranan 3-O-arabinosyltransferase